MKISKRGLPLNLLTGSSLVALAMVGSAWGASPYDMPYGVQWNFQIGSSGNDMGGGSGIAVADDGTLFIQNRTGETTWGEGTGGNVRGGVGALTPLGGKLYGTTISSLPTLNSPGQQYSARVHASGNRGIFACYGAQNQYWNGEDGKDGARAMVWSLDASGLDSISNQRSISVYADNAGTLRADGLVPTTTGLTPVGGQNRIQSSAFRASTMDMVLVMDMVSGDFATAGDYEGYGLRNSGAGNAYLPGIGVYNFTSNTLAGPAKQPLLTYSGETGSNFATYLVAGIDQSTGLYAGGGLSHARGESTSDTFDPDGSGPAAPISISGPSGIGTAYDSAHNLLYAVVWDTPGYDTINFVEPTNDGSNGVFWAGEKEDECHIELRDVTGAVVWSDTFDQSPVDGGGTVGVERIAGVKVDADGNLIVTGYFENGGANATNPRSDAYDNFVRKYEKTGTNTYVVQWAATVGLAGIRDLMYDAAFDPTDQTVYILSDVYGTETNTTGFVYGGGSDLLVRKLIAGDFNADGIVDFTNDVQTAGDATKPADLTDDDTYDFNGDGDSTFADTEFFITTLLDRDFGDVAQDSAATDVDNADLGKAIGNSGSGTLYIDGDFDWDGDVDSDDVTAMAAAFNGATAPGRYSVGTTGTTLTYVSDSGRVILSADGATGGVITSFQLENGEGSFVAGAYSGPTAGSFGGGLAEATADVLADTDLTLTGFTGDLSLGGVFPTGMDQAGLEAYLTTAIYTGAAGSGQMDFDLVYLPTLPTPYENWVADYPALTNTFANFDFEGDNLSAGLEFVLGGDPTVNDAASILPTSASDGSGLVFTYRRADIANDDPDAVIGVYYSTDLQTWTLAEDGLDSVGIASTDDFYDTGIDQVVVTLPSSLSPDGRLFARLAVSGLPELLLGEDFEGGAVPAGWDTSGEGTVWSVGTPAGDGTASNSEPSTAAGGSFSAGTNMNGQYANSADARLISPAFTVPAGGATLQLSYFIDTDAASGGNDFGTIRLLNAADGTPLVGGEVASDIQGISGDWLLGESLPLPAAANGLEVKVEFAFTSDDDGVNWAGFYIDDVLITAP